MSDLSRLHGKAVRDEHGRKIENLQYWGKQGFIRVHVKNPPELRGQLGQEFNRALKTQNVAEAVRRMHGPMAECQAKIDALREPKVFMQVRQAPLSFNIGNLHPAELQQVRAFIAANFPQTEPGSVRGVFGATGDWRLAKPQGLWDWVPQKEADKLPADLPLAGVHYQQVIEDWKITAKPRAASVDVVTAHVSYFFKCLGHGDVSRVTKKDRAGHIRLKRSLAERRCHATRAWLVSKTESSYRPAWN